MEPIFTEDQLKNMSREALIELMQVMQEKQRKTETKMKLMEEKQKELEFLNAMLSDRLQRNSVLGLPVKNTQMDMSR